MRTLLTLDYEVFFGQQTGSVERCLIEPTEALVSLAARHGGTLVFFVDAGYLLRLRAEMSKSGRLQRDWSAVSRQLDVLVTAGHEIQLHVHSHWERSYWDADRSCWQLDLSRYALHSFDRGEVADIVTRYTDELRRIAGRDAAMVYRAGGWVIQPFAHLRDALAASGVWIDSTVFHGGHVDNDVARFDFRSAPTDEVWRFDADPLRPDPNGRFLEVAISSIDLSPAFFWRLAWMKKFGGAAHRQFGDGRAVQLGREDLLRKLLHRSTSVVSLDGYKASYLAPAASKHRQDGGRTLVAIGHPKALTRYSLRCLESAMAEGVLGQMTGYSVFRDPGVAGTM